MARYTKNPTAIACTCPTFTERVVGNGISCDSVIFKDSTISPSAGLYFNTSLSTGVYLPSANTISIKCSSNDKVTVGTASIDISADVATTTLNSLVESTNTSSGAVVTPGGIGVGGALNIGGSLNVTGSITVGGSWLAGDGTAAAPSYSFANDTGTGMYLTATNSLGFSIGSSNILTIGDTSAAIAAGVQLNLASTGSTSLAVTGGLGVAKSVI